MIQQGVSVGGTAGTASPNSQSLGGSGGNEMTIGKVMDWIEARLEAIKSREEEEDEDEEKERTKNSAYSATPSAPRQTAAKPPPAETIVSAARAKVQVRVTENWLDSVTNSRLEQPQPVTLPLTPNSPTQLHSYAPSTSSPPSPSPPPTPLITHRPVHQLPKSSKSRVAFPNISSDVHKLSPTASAVPATGEEALGLGAGAKRRHAVMMMLDSAAPPVDLSSISADTSSGNAGTSMAIGSGSISYTGGRRRTRSTRAQQSSEAMDVEEDGRERKRVARR